MAAELNWSITVTFVYKILHSTAYGCIVITCLEITRSLQANLACFKSGNTGKFFKIHPLAIQRQAVIPIRSQIAFGGNGTTFAAYSQATIHLVLVERHITAKVHSPGQACQAKSGRTRLNIGDNCCHYIFIGKTVVNNHPSLHMLCERINCHGSGLYTETVVNRRQRYSNIRTILTVISVHAEPHRRNHILRQSHEKGRILGGKAIAVETAGDCYITPCAVGTGHNMIGCKTASSGSQFKIADSDTVALL